MIDLAEYAKHEPVSLAAVAERQSISISYLEQLISKLKKAGIVQSTRGAQGGYTLAKAPEEISVGGTDNVDAAVFDGFDYVALGHIHRPQNMGGERIRYCGTPLKYSFSEAGHQKSVTVAELKRKGDLSVREIPLVPLRDMKEIKGMYEDITLKSYYDKTSLTEDYLHITLTDEEDVPDAIGKLRIIYKNLMKLDYDNTRTRSGGYIDVEASVEAKTPIELFSDFYEAQNGKPMSDKQQEYMNELIERVWEVEI